MSNDAYHLLLNCRAVRHFTANPLPDDDLRRILQAGRWAGSAKNVQPWQFIAVRNREMLNNLAECGRYASHLQGAAAAVVIVTAANTWADFDAGRAAQNMMLAACALGIGSCIASLHDMEQAKAFLNIPAELQAHTAISFGYPLENAPQTIEGHPREQILASIGRKPLEDLVHWETW